MTKTTKKDAPETEPDTGAEETVDDGVLVVDFDPGSFNRTERRHVQARFGRQFEELITYVNAGFLDTVPRRVRVADQDDPDDESKVTLVTVMPPEAPAPFTGPDGKTIYADDVLIGMLMVVIQRDQPGAEESMFDDYTTQDLLVAINRGRPGKAGKRPASSKT